MLSMLVTTKVKVNRLCSVLKTFSKMFSYQRAEATAPRLLVPLLDHAMSPRWPPIHSAPGRELSSQLSDHERAPRRASG